MALVLAWTHPDTGATYPAAYVRLHSWTHNTVMHPAYVDRDGVEHPAEYGRGPVVATWYVYADEAARAAWAPEAGVVVRRVPREAVDFADLEPSLWAALKADAPFSGGTDV